MGKYKELTNEQLLIEMMKRQVKHKEHSEKSRKHFNKWRAAMVEYAERKMDEAGIEKCQEIKYINDYGVQITTTIRGAYLTDAGLVHISTKNSQRSFTILDCLAALTNE